jgi:hypothetical protein
MVKSVDVTDGCSITNGCSMDVTFSASNSNRLIEEASSLAFLPT